MSDAGRDGLGTLRDAVRKRRTYRCPRALMRLPIGGPAAPARDVAEGCTPPTSGNGVTPACAAPDMTTPPSSGVSATHARWRVGDLPLDSEAHMASRSRVKSVGAQSVPHLVERVQGKAPGGDSPQHAVTKGDSASCVGSASPRFGVSRQSVWEKPRARFGVTVRHMWRMYQWVHAMASGWLDTRKREVL
jgi:hypothetical protein